MRRSPRIASVAAVLAAGIALSACGGAATSPLADATNVISGWSTALRHGDLRAAARYFALPSLFINGGAAGSEEVEIRTVAQARFVNATLSCGARLISVRRDGGFFNGRFELTRRPGPGGSDCGGGVGAAAFVDFAISKGRITAWIRVESSTAPAPSLTAPGPGLTEPPSGPSTPSTPTINPPDSNPAV